MSADNYFLIRKEGHRFVVSMGFASDDFCPIEKHDPRFDTLQAARQYAYEEYSEYGVREDIEELGYPKLTSLAVGLLAAAVAWMIVQ